MPDFTKHPLFAAIRLAKAGLLSASGDSEALRSIPGLREYRARFLSGQPQNIIVRVIEDGADRVRYGQSIDVRSDDPISLLSVYAVALHGQQTPIH
jgi:hypothetical protein